MYWLSIQVVALEGQISGQNRIPVSNHKYGNRGRSPDKNQPLKVHLNRHRLQGNAEKRTEGHI